MPKVSVIIPVYNVEQYLRECLDSVVNQTLKDIEIICVNDGSTDRSLDILKEYAANDNRIKIIDKTNSGYGDSMNKGIEAAGGEYIGIVEPDDYVVLDMYEVLFNKAKELDLDLIKADFNRFLGSKENIRLIYNRLDGSGKYYNKVINLQEDIAPFKFVMNTWSGIYKRSFIEKHHIRHNVTPGASFQDNGFWFQTFAWAKRAYFLDKPLYMNRRDNINSSVKSRGKVYAMKYEYDFIREFLDKNAGLKTRLLGVYQHKKFQNYMFTFGRIDISHKKEFINFFSNEFKKARDELDLSLFSPKELKALNLIIKNPVRYYQKTLNRLSLAEKIFSLRNEGQHKVLKIFGLKFKFKNKRRELVQKIEELEVILRTSVKSIILQNEKTEQDMREAKSAVETLALQNKKAEQDTKEIKTAVDNLMCLYNTSEETTQKNLSQILKYARELNYRNVFVETVSKSEWLKEKTFTLINGGANYSFAFQLYNILNLAKPDTILEFGMGQTTLLTSQYANYFKKDLTIVDHVQEWINEFSKKIEIGNSIKIIQKDIINFELNGATTDKYAPLDDIVQNKKFDLIIIDGPFGFDRVYPRTNILDLIPENLNKHFVIILDDIDRAGEQNTAKLIFEALSKNGIEYKKSYKHGLKSQLIISSADYNFIHWY